MEGEGPAPSGLPASFTDMLVGLDAAPAWTLSGKPSTLLPPSCQMNTGKVILDEFGIHWMYAVPLRMLQKEVLALTRGDHSFCLQERAGNMPPRHRQTAIRLASQVASQSRLCCSKSSLRGFKTLCCLHQRVQVSRHPMHSVSKI